MRTKLIVVAVLIACSVGLTYADQHGVASRVIIPTLDLRDATVTAALTQLENIAHTSKLDWNTTFPQSIDETSPHITLKLNNIPLSEAIRYVCEQANLRYHIEKSAVLIYTADREQQKLITRIYRVNPGVFEQTILKSEGLLQGSGK